MRTAERRGSDLPRPGGGHERRTMGPGRRAPSLGHRPGLDGLRALAVLAVLAYHTGALRSGWIGVDVFFALSGYLITGLLLVELDATGTISLRRFWSRRMRRLVPGVFLLVGFVALLGRLRLPGWQAPELGDITGAVTYSSNWMRIAAQRSYWNLFKAPGPLDHVWSLAIEEQFYVVWPLLVWFAGRRRRSWIGPLAAVALVVTATVQLWLGVSGAPIERLYVGTDTRAPAFLLGALAVIVVDRGGAAARWAGYAVPVGIAWLLAASVILDGQWRGTYQGVLLGLSTLGALTVAGCARLPAGGRVARTLTAPPMQALGRWSYGIYLFHWPVAVAVRHWEMLAVQRFVLVGMISVPLAALSYELLEHPIRTRGIPIRLRIPALVTTGAILLAACGGVAPQAGRRLDAATRTALLTPLAPLGGGEASGSATVTGDGQAPPVVEQDPEPASVPVATEREPVSDPVTAPPADPPDTTRPPSAADPPVSTPGDVAGTALAGPVVASPQNAIRVAPGQGRIVVVGDSVPFQLAPLLTAAAASRGITAYVRAAPGCTPSTDRADHYRDDTRELCASVQASLGDDLIAVRPQALVVFYGLSGAAVYEHGVKLDSCAAGGGALHAQLQRIVDLAKAAGTTVFLVPPTDPPAAYWLDPAAEGVGADCYRGVYDTIAGEHPDSVRLVGLDSFVCPDGAHGCSGVLDGVQLRYDGIHYSDKGAEVVVPWLLDRLLSVTPG